MLFVAAAELAEVAAGEGAADWDDDAALDAEALADDELAPEEAQPASANAATIIIAAAAIAKTERCLFAMVMNPFAYLLFLLVGLEELNMHVALFAFDKHAAISRIGQIVTFAVLAASGALSVFFAPTMFARSSRLSSSVIRL